jgi:Flp pilus assembly protein TadG
MMSLSRFIRHYLRDRRAAAMMLFAFAAVPLCFAVGMGVDYARAMKAQTKLNAVADAAALRAVSKSLLLESDEYAVFAARQMFELQSQPILEPARITITSLTVTAPTDSSGRRTATVKYTAESGNSFSRILGLGSLSIGGTSVTTNATAPDINFYMLLDISGSMAFPVTSAGLATVAKSNSRSCQFACHSTNDPIVGRDASGNMTSLYNVAKSYGLKLRIDEEGAAVQALANDATSTSSKNGATYQLGIWTFRGKGGFTKLSGLDPNMIRAAKTAENLEPGLYYKNSCPTVKCLPSEVGYNDRDTATSDAMDQINAYLQAPGTGLNGNPSQGVLFLVTDGMRDEIRASGRPEVAIDTSKCTMIKDRGIRIAVLYTEYLPQSLDNDGWSQTNVKPYLNQVEPALQACASEGLYTKVTTDQDISQALDKLFQNAVATARITG